MSEKNPFSSRERMSDGLGRVVSMSDLMSMAC